jgi:hypothetical protein
MLRKHASLVIAVSLIAMVTAACIVRSQPVRRGSQPVYVEKHKPVKHKKHKKHRH